MGFVVKHLGWLASSEGLKLTRALERLIADSSSCEGCHYTGISEIRGPKVDSAYGFVALQHTSLLAASCLQSSKEPISGLRVEAFGHGFKV